MFLINLTNQLILSYFFDGNYKKLEEVGQKLEVQSKDRTLGPRTGGPGRRRLPGRGPGASAGQLRMPLRLAMLRWLFETCFAALHFVGLQNVFCGNRQICRLMQRWIQLASA